MCKFSTTKLFKWATIFLLSVLGHVGLAKASLPMATGCNGCTFAQIQATAIANYKSTKPLVGGQSSQYIYDINGNAFYAFFIDSEPAENGRPAYTIARQLTVPTAMASLFGKYRAAVIANSGSQTFNLTVVVRIASPLSTNPDGSYHDNGYIGFYPVSADTSKKAQNEPKGVSCPSEESSVKSSSAKRWG